jgi:hypothetical protein
MSGVVPPLHWDSYCTKAFNSAEYKMCRAAELIVYQNKQFSARRNEVTAAHHTKEKSNGKIDVSEKLRFITLLKSLETEFNVN